MTKAKFIIIVSLLVAFGTYVNAQTVTWEAPGIWNPSAPDATLDAVIAFDYSEDANLVSKTLTINPGVTMQINSNYSLSVLNNVTNDGTLTIKSSNLGDGSTIFLNGAIGGIGTYNVERYISSGQWHLVTSPITTGTAGVFEGMWLRPYNEATNLFSPDYIVPTGTTMPTGQGFMVWTNNTETRVFTGVLNQGNIGPINIQLTGIPAANQGWNLIGNPYSSAIDWDAAGWTKNNIADAVYVWNGTQYASYVAGAGANGGSNIITMGQGFFVQATAPGADISMTSATQVHSLNHFLKETSEPLDIIRININGNGQSDEAVIAIRESNANAYDPQTDAVKLPGSTSAPQMYTTKEDLSQLAINSVNNVNDVFGKAVYMDYAQDGQHTISWSHTLQGTTIPVLYDNLTATAIQPETPYTFTASSTDPAERFTFTEISMGIENQLTNINVWENNNILYIQNLTNSPVNNVSIYNMQGQLVMEFTGNVKDLSSLSAAVYVVKVNAGDNTVVEKVIVK